MSERSETAGTPVTGNDPLQRSSGTAGGMASENREGGMSEQPGTNMGDTGKSGETLGHIVGEKIDEMSEKIGETKTTITEKSRDNLDVGKEKLGGEMKTAAEMIRDHTGDTSGLPHEAGTKLADTMDKTATYLHQHSSDEIWSDVESYVREHPTQALVGAVLAGLVMGRVLR